MSITDQMIRQRDFSAGEIDPDAIRRDDVEALAFGVRYARNLVSTHTGAVIRSPGRRFLFEDYGVIMDFKPFDDVAYSIIFVHQGVKVRSPSGALIASLPAPWTVGDLDTIVAEEMENEIFVAWRGRTKVLRVAEGTLAWSIGDYQFATGLDGSIRMPFYRFEVTQGITMLPSGSTGAITVTFSAPVLNALHAGVIFRYAGRQIRIDAVHSPTLGSATVLEPLPSTFAVTVQSSAGFSIGQIVETDTTNARGEVVGINGNIVYMVPVDTLTTPQVDERLVGPTASSKITAVSATTAGAVIQWDEQFISDFRGWPRSVSKDRERLIFCDFAQKKNAVFWSAGGNNRDGAIGANPDNAMLEFITAECQVFYVVGGYDEFAVTDKGVFFIPISVGAPLQPGSVEFRPIFASEISSIKPIQVTEGLIFVDESRTGLYVISATGQTARPYVASEINRLHRHLFSEVKSIAATSATREFPARQIYAVNGDGTYVVGQFNPDREYIGWLKQDRAGRVLSVSGSYGRVTMMAAYTFGGVEYGVAEELDYSLLCDCAVTYDANSPSDYLQFDDGSPLEMANGTYLGLDGTIVGFHAGKEVSVYADGFYFGKTVIPTDGLLTGFGQYAEVTLGVDFDWVLKPLFVNIDGGQPVGQGEQRRKIEKMLLTVRGTQEFQVGARIFGSYRGGEDMEAPVPERDETYRYRETGRSYDPDVEIRSTFPGKFKLIELATRITV